MSLHSHTVKNARLELNEACQLNGIKYPIFESSKIKGQWQSYCHFQGRHLSSMLAERKKDAEENLAGLCLQVLNQSIRQGFIGSEDLESKVLESDSSDEEKSIHCRTPRARPISYNHILDQLEKIKSQMSRVTEEKIVFANNPLDTDLIKHIQSNCAAKKIVFIHTPKRPNLLTPVPEYDISIYLTDFGNEQKEIEFITTLTYEGRKAVFVMPCRNGEEKYVTSVWMNVFLQLGSRIVDVLADEYASDFFDVPITVHEH